jgi:hypothetical protein
VGPAIPGLNFGAPNPGRRVDLLFDDPAHKLGRGGCVIRIVPVDQNINVRFKSANMPRTTLPLPCRVSVRTTAPLAGPPRLCRRGVIDVNVNDGVRQACLKIGNNLRNGQTSL